MSEHEHEWGEPADFPIGTAMMCTAQTDCTEWAVRDTGQRWRAPTPTELTSLVMHMMEAIVIAQTMQIIHGRERGMVRARQALGYDR